MAVHAAHGHAQIYDGSSALVKNALCEDSTSGHLFVFINRRHTRIKVPYFDRSSCCVWSKRLERGRFQDCSEDADKLAQDWTRPKLPPEGIEVRENRRYKRYSHPQPVRAEV